MTHERWTSDLTTEALQKLTRDEDPQTASEAAAELRARETITTKESAA